MHNLEQRQGLRPFGVVADGGVDVAVVEEREEEDGAAQDAEPEDAGDGVVENQTGGGGCGVSGVYGRGERRSRGSSENTDYLLAREEPCERALAVAGLPDIAAAGVEACGGLWWLR